VLMYALYNSRSHAWDVMEMMNAELKLSKRKNVAVKNTLRRLVSEEGSSMDLEVADDQGNSVVHYAAQLGCCRSVLTPHGTSPAVVCAPNKFGITPLHVAADRGIHDEVKVSISYTSVYVFSAVPIIASYLLVSQLFVNQKSPI